MNDNDSESADFSENEGQITIPILDSQEDLNKHRISMKLIHKQIRTSDKYNDDDKKILKEIKQEKEITIKKPIVSCFTDYKISDVIGRGKLATIFKGFNNKTGKFVAVKELSLSEVTVRNEIANILREIQYLRDLHHPNIVEFIDFHTIEGSSLYIVLEYMENGSLKDVIKNFGKLKESLVAKYSIQILKGLEYIHSLNIVHRNICCSNILSSKIGTCKLSNFRSATKLNPNELINEHFHITRWSAPEICKKQQITVAVDIWSFGCTIIEMLTGFPPYNNQINDDSDEKTIIHIIRHEKPNIPSDISENLINLLNICFQKNPKKRKTVKKLLSHPWILSNQPKKTNSLKRNKIKYKDIHDILKPYDKKIDISLTNGGLTDDDILDLVSSHSFDILKKLQLKKSQIGYIDNLQTPIDVLRDKLAELELENTLLVYFGEHIQESLTSQLISISQNLQKTNIDLEQSEQLKKSIAQKISILEESYVSVKKSDYPLAKLIYGDSIPISYFTNGIRGVLLLKKVKIQGELDHQQQKKYKWQKRWILLQDNFLFCYEKAESTNDPDIVIRLANHKIVPVAERDIGKKFVFLLTSPNHQYYFAAANPQFLMKWISLISDVTSWYQSDDEILFQDFEYDGVKISRRNSEQNEKSPRKKRALTVLLTPVQKEARNPSKSLTHKQ